MPDEIIAEYISAIKKSEKERTITLYALLGVIGVLVGLVIHYFSIANLFV